MEMDIETLAKQVSVLRQFSILGRVMVGRQIIDGIRLFPEQKGAYCICIKEIQIAPTNPDDFIA
jgi:hypothetical protein